MPIETVLLVALGVYTLTGIVLVLFAEPIYLKARYSERLPDAGKGLFAQAIISYYLLKKEGITTHPKHLGYCLAFNAGISITVTLIVAFYTAALAILLAIVVGAVVLALFFIVLAALGGGSK